MKIEAPSEIPPAREIGPVHLIGIGGAGLSAIARLMAQQGISVSGSDAKESAVLDALRDEGIACFAGHAADHLGEAQTVIASTAVREDNPELIEARRRGIRVWPRSAGLKSIMAGRRTIAVAGTHGKTTTTAMLTYALRAAGAQPSFAIGAEVAGLGTNASLGQSDLLVAEADESDGAFLVYEPDVAIVTNIDADHLDVWGTAEAYAAAFDRFAASVGSLLVVDVDDPGAALMAERAVRPGLKLLRTGFHDDADIRARDIVVTAGATTFTVEIPGEAPLGVSLAVPGEHYAHDALLALAAGLALGYDAHDLAEGLGQYTGALRRMQLLGVAGGITVYDSYAHHPTEIRADLAAARAIAGDARLVVAFQPHLVSRTRLYGAQMGAELSAADSIVVADIYLAREDPDPDVTSAVVVDAVIGKPAVLGGPIETLAAFLVERLRPGDVLFTLGAGDITEVGPQVLSALEYVAT